MADPKENKEPTEQVPAAGAASPKEEPSMGALKAACDGLTANVTEEMARRERALNLSIKIQAGLLVFVLLYLGYIYAQISAFDPDTAMLIVRARMESELPSATQDAIAKMKASAPEVVSQWTTDLNDSMPRMRTRLEADILRHTGELSKTLETDLTDLTTQMIKDAKAEIDKMDPDLSGKEKRAKLAEELHRHYQKESRAAVDHVAGEFSKDTRKLIAQVKRLQAGKNLTPKEQYERKLLAVWSKLITGKTKDVRKAVEEGMDLSEDTHVTGEEEASPAAASPAPAEK